MDVEKQQRFEMRDMQDEIQSLRNKVSECKPQWISCKERLPDETGRYLVYVENIANYHHLPQNIILADWFFKSWNFTGWEYNRVTHWMPLPTPPEKPYQEWDRIAKEREE